ncbi:hypothetical protein LTR17_025393 [Elasticomyces elasticus]|nr:hypothetical protein LTR17_025393 [Elasticomyces elasticus]
MLQNAFDRRDSTTVMFPRLPTSRSVRVAPPEAAYKDSKGKLQVIHTLIDAVGLGRALQIVPLFDRITRIIAVDIEFQQVYVESLGKHRHRIGRLSFVNYDGKVIYDVFAFYPEEDGKTKKLTPRKYGMGIYWEDISPANGARPVIEVEAYAREIMLQAEIVVGHAIKNDIKVCSNGLFEGISLRDTQLHEPYRNKYGKRPQREPKLTVLAWELLAWNIQGKEHLSAEDAAATMFVLREDEEAIHAAQGPGGVELKFKGGFEGRADFDGFDESLLEEAPIEEMHPDHVEMVKMMAEMPVPAAGVFWQKAAPNTKTPMASNNPRNNIKIDSPMSSIEVKPGDKYPSASASSATSSKRSSIDSSQVTTLSTFSSTTTSIIAAKASAVPLINMNGQVGSATRTTAGAQQAAKTASIMLWAKYGQGVSDNLAEVTKAEASKSAGNGKVVFKLSKRA